jgi:protein-tyrosine phosphatase
MKEKTKLLFVCLGNICRSPTAQGIMDKIIEEKNLQDKIETDSCGTSGWHIGSPPDDRATYHASKRGYDLTKYQGRQVKFEDFYDFDLILAMDESNYEDLIDIAPHDLKDKVHLMLDYGTSGKKSVPDPYYGGDKGFEEVLDLLEESCKNLFEEILKR